MSSQWRTWAGWLSGLLVFVCLTALAFSVLAQLGLVVRFEHEPVTIRAGHAEWESSSGLMSYALALAAIAGMVAFRVGALVSTGRLDAGMSLKEHASFNAWLFGLASFAGLTLLIETGLRRLDAMWLNLLELAALALVAWVFMKWRDRRHLEIAEVMEAEQGNSVIGKGMRRERP